MQQLVQIEPKSAALVGGTLCGLLGGIGAVGWVAWLAYAESMTSITVGDGLPGTVMGLALALVLIPTFAAFYGALLSGLMAWLFNATAKRTGGVAVTLEEG